MFGTVTSQVPVKRYQSVPVREVNLAYKFGTRSYSTSRNLTDKQNHMILAISCHHHLRRKRCICSPTFVTVSPLQKEMCLTEKSHDYVAVQSLSPVGDCYCGGFFFKRYTAVRILPLKIQRYN